MKVKLLILISILSLPILLSSCSSKPNHDQQPDKTVSIIQSQVLVTDILKGNRVIVLANQDQLYLVDPDFAKPVPVYQFKNSETPINKNYNNFKISPSKKRIVWYTPHQGLISLDINSQQTEIVEPASDFFNTYPYFEFLENQDIINVIVNKGYALKQINLDNKQENLINIPYPYGTVFKISPDEKTVLFVSGYGQNQETPKFMFTSINGSVSQQFPAEANIFDRNRVFWAVDSSGIILINKNSLDLYPVINPTQSSQLLSLKDEAQISSVYNLGQFIFILDNQDYWHVYDFYSKKEIARTPTSIAKELQAPKFIPWTKESFLIEEKIADGDFEFNRLWVSDFRGNKKIIFERYNDVKIQDLQPSL